MFNYKKINKFFLYTLVNIFICNSIFPYTENSFTKFKTYLKNENPKKYKNPKLKEVTTKEINILSEKIIQNISNKKNNILSATLELEKLILELNQTKNKKSCLKKINKKAISIKKGIEKYLPINNKEFNVKDNILNTYLNDLDYIINSINNILEKNNPTKLKKMSKKLFWGLLIGAGIISSTLYFKSKNNKTDNGKLDNPADDPNKIIENLLSESSEQEELNHETPATFGNESEDDDNVYELNTNENPKETMPETSDNKSESSCEESINSDIDSNEDSESLPLSKYSDGEQGSSSDQFNDELTNKKSRYCEIEKPSSSEESIDLSGKTMYSSNFVIYEALEKEGLLNKYNLTIKNIAQIHPEKLKNIYFYIASKDKKHLKGQTYEELSEEFTKCIKEYVSIKKKKNSSKPINPNLIKFRLIT
jgi:hypothetical protein